MHRENPSPLGFQLTFGANSVANTIATRYLPIGYNPGTAVTSALDVPVTIPMVVYEIRMHARVPGGAGQTLTGTLRKGGIATAAALVTASDASSGLLTLESPVFFVRGDTIGFQTDKSAAFTSPFDLFYTLGIYS